MTCRVESHVLCFLLQDMSLKALPNWFVVLVHKDPTVSQCLNSTVLNNLLNLVSSILQNQLCMETLPAREVIWLQVDKSCVNFCSLLLRKNFPKQCFPRAGYYLLYRNCCKYWNYRIYVKQTTQKHVSICSIKLFSHVYYKSYLN